MPTIQVLTPPIEEPVSVTLLKQQARIDSDSEDELLLVYLTAAREKVEAETGRFYAKQTLAYTFSLEEPYQLPVGATPVAVSGYFDTLEAVAGLGSYLEEYRKGISINREYPLAWVLAQSYTVVVKTAGDPQYAGIAKQVILALAAEYYKNREITELSVRWRVDLAPARVNVLGIS
jgi:hypothetical protein